MAGEAEQINREPNLVSNEEFERVRKQREAEEFAAASLEQTASSQKAAAEMQQRRVPTAQELVERPRPTLSTEEAESERIINTMVAELEQAKNPTEVLNKWINSGYAAQHPGEVIEAQNRAKRPAV